MNRDLAFLSRLFETEELPKEKAYLYKYFKTAVQEAFVKYVHVFGNYDNFMEHTGHRCSKRWLDNLHERLVKLESEHREAKQNMDFELLARIESGKHRDSVKFNRREDEEIVGDSGADLPNGGVE